MAKHTQPTIQNTPAAKQSGDTKDAIDQVITDWVQDRIGKETLEGFQCHHFVPFDPVSKRTEAVVEWMGGDGGGDAMFSFQVKGRPFRVRKTVYDICSTYLVVCRVSLCSLCVNYIFGGWLVQVRLL